MSEERQSLRKIFNEAVEIADAQQRSDYLASACGADTALRQRIEELIAADAEAGRFLDGVGDTVGNAGRNTFCPGDKPNEPTLRRFGDYELLEEIARGGMGIVYKARQVGLDRIVAVKLLLLGQYASEEFIHRFRIEASAAASLQHPNIVSIHEVGVHQRQHYFAMDFVDGPDLAQIVRNGPLTAKRAAGYVKTIAEAIHFAHTRRILHRDLKPSNVLIDSNDQPRVTDFGLAKNLGNDSDLTLTGQVMGSPGFMPPEQALGDRGKMGPASDVYSLGAILYHALTGRAPFVGQSVSDTLQQVQNKEPIAPRLLAPSVPVDLETICLKCLEKEAAKRFFSAQELADELSRFLCDEPIRSRPVSAPEKFWRWCRRKPVVAALSTATLVLLVAVAVGAPLAALRINNERRRTQGEQVITRRNLYAADMFLVQHALDEGNYGLALRTLEAHRPKLGEEELRGFEWRYFWKLCQGENFESWGGHSNIVSCLAVSPDGKTLAAGSRDSFIRLRDLASDRLVTTFSVMKGHVNSVAFSSDGRLLAAGNDSGPARLWELDSGKEIASYDGEWVRVVFSPIDPVLAVSTGEGITGRGGIATVRLWDCIGQRQVGAFTNLGSRAAFSPNGKVLAVGSVRGDITLWEIASGRLKQTLTNGGSVISVAFSPDGQQVAASNWEGELLLWNVVTGQRSEPLSGHAARIWNVAFSPGGKILATASSDQRIGLWDVESKSRKRWLHGHGSEVWPLAFLSDGTKLATGSKDETVKFWDLAPEKSATVITAKRGLLGPLALSKDGKTTASGLPTGEVKVWDLTTGRTRVVISNDFYHALSVGFINRDEVLVTLTTNYVLRFWDWETPRLLAKLVLSATNELLGAAQLSPDAKVLATGSTDGRVSLWNPTIGLRLVTCKNHMSPIHSLAFSPNSGYLAAACGDGAVRLLDVQTHHEIVLSGTHRDEVMGVTFSPDGSFIASASSDGTARIWESTTRREVAILAGYKEGLRSVAFTSDSRTLAAGGEKVIKLWHVVSHRELAAIKIQGINWFTGFSLDGRTLITAVYDDAAGNSVQLWGVPTLAEIDGLPSLAE